MKKICTILLVLTMLLSLSGCAEGEDHAQDENFIFTYRDIPIMPGAKAAPIIEALGQPKGYTEEASCAFDGVDKTYFYGSFYLATCPIDGKDCVYNIWFVDDTVATQEGISIGSAQSQVEDAYGKECFDGVNSFSLIKGSAKLTILIEEGVVKSVCFEMILK